MSTWTAHRQIYMLLMLPVLQVFFSASAAQNYHDQKSSRGIIPPSGNSKSAELIAVNQKKKEKLNKASGYRSRRAFGNSLQLAVTEKDGSEYTQ